MLTNQTILPYHFDFIFQWKVKKKYDMTRNAHPISSSGCPSIWRSGLKYESFLRFLMLKAWMFLGFCVLEVPVLVFKVCSSRVKPVTITRSTEHYIMHFTTGVCLCFDFYVGLGWHIMSYNFIQHITFTPYLFPQSCPKASVKIVEVSVGCCFVFFLFQV